MDKTPHPRLQRCGVAGDRVRGGISGAVNTTEWMLDHHDKGTGPALAFLFGVGELTFHVTKAIILLAWY